MVLYPQGAVLRNSTDSLILSLAPLALLAMRLVGGGVRPLVVAEVTGFYIPAPIGRALTCLSFYLALGEHRSVF